ncbi:hypothetical protein GCM10008942_06450 [Rhizomicrobium electricum]|uniref:Uncharacterized protein n=1 Tax=Rhizomicrobium electricum TaxID=480070 RepID=A0ABP3P5R6_9PROT
MAELFATGRKHRRADDLGCKNGGGVPRPCRHDVCSGNARSHNVASTPLFRPLARYARHGWITAAATFTKAAFLNRETVCVVNKGE